MSGILGIVYTGERSTQKVPHSDLLKMQNAIKHRGPDASQLWQAPGIGLGHLAQHVSPESVYENLPFESLESGLTITADARLFYRDDLSERLSIPISQRPTLPDSELILKAYQKWGEKCTQYLEGEFAFAIWDKHSKKLFCARDHFGIRSFFYYYSDDILVFCSEVKGIRALDFVPSDFNENLLPMMTISGERDFKNTFFRNIFRLKPAHALSFNINNRKSDIRMYWAPQRQSSLKYTNDFEYAEALRDLVINAVHNRIRILPHLKVSTHLSGGLDSSAIACIAAKKLLETDQKLIAVSSVLDENHTGIESDERPYIRAVVEAYPNIELKYVTASDTGPLDFETMDRLIYETESKLDSFFYMSHALSWAAKQSGATLLLCGIGGDSWASYNGRDSVYELLIKKQWLTAAQLIIRLSRIEKNALHSLFENYILKYAKRNFVFKWQNDKRSETAFQNEFFTRFKKNGRTEKKKSDNVPGDLLARLSNKLRKGRFMMEDEMIRLSHQQISGGFPYWDKRLIEFTLRVPPEQFMLNGVQRGLFRRAMDGILPPKVQWRKDKHPFTPDFHRRVIAGKDVISNFLNSINKDDRVWEYFDAQKIFDQLERVRPVYGRYDWETKTQSIVVESVILIRFIHWIMGGCRKWEL